MISAPPNYGISRKATRKKVGKAETRAEAKQRGLGIDLDLRIAVEVEDEDTIMRGPRAVDELGVEAEIQDSIRTNVVRRRQERTKSTKFSIVQGPERAETKDIKHITNHNTATYTLLVSDIMQFPLLVPKLIHYLAED